MKKVKKLYVFSQITKFFPVKYVNKNLPSERIFCFVYILIDFTQQP